MREQYYTPQRIDYWLRHWGDLEALAESPGTARGLLHGRSGYTDGPRVGRRQRGAGSDRLRYAAVRADLAAAWHQFPPASMERQVIGLRMQGYSLSLLSRLIRCRKQLAIHTYHHAVERMAHHLGWTATQAA